MGLHEQNCQYVWLPKHIPTVGSTNLETGTFRVYSAFRTETPGFSSATTTQFNYFLLHKGEPYSFYAYFKTKEKEPQDMSHYFSSIPVCSGSRRKKTKTKTLHSIHQSRWGRSPSCWPDPWWLWAAKTGVRAESPASLHSPPSSEQGQMQSNRMVSRKSRAGCHGNKAAKLQRAFFVPWSTLTLFFVITQFP